ncbi:AAA family ATPase [Streptomyces sp. W16]|uniref:AAA family ATPase n=1 Tax=Streptomyces sp. W16 TaxID=3076631 RepID=UPI00295B7E4C|nr:AAA family ATPase [Streptomyces sp. W16]MDV9173446.1 AAA family ATPase [Streptomyces sp. W16]
MTTHQPIRIGVLGTHSTGKTTLLKRIEMELRAEGITVGRTSRLGKRAAAAGLPKMQRHTARSTEWIITQGIADEIAAIAQGAEVVLDRAAHDALAYFHAALEYRGETAPRTEHKRLHALAATQLPKYHLLLATVLDESVPVDPRHDYDPRYRRLVDQHVHQLLDRDDIPHLRVHSDPDSQAHIVDEAVRSCLTEALV